VLLIVCPTWKWARIFRYWVTWVGPRGHDWPDRGGSIHYNNLFARLRCFWPPSQENIHVLGRGFTAISFPKVAHSSRIILLLYILIW